MIVMSHGTGTLVLYVKGIVFLLSFIIVDNTKDFSILYVGALYVQMKLVRWTYMGPVIGVLTLEVTGLQEGLMPSMGTACIRDIQNVRVDYGISSAI